MVKYFIRRPVAVLMIFITLMAAGAVLVWKVPVSLLPHADIPQITIRVNYPNTAASTLEQNVLRPIREGLQNLDRIRSIESQAGNHAGIIQLAFEHNTRMDLAFIEVNEKLDRLAGSFPPDMQRPQVIRTNTSDIPVIRLQVIPRNPGDFMMISALAEKVLKKRLEQLDGVSMVDINGRQQGIITLTPRQDQLMALGLSEDLLAQTVQRANRNLGSLNVRDGQYRYFVRLGNTLTAAEEIGRLPVRLADGTVLPLQRLAVIGFEPEEPSGHHLYNGKESLVITIQKQPGSRMNELVPKIKEAVNVFGTDHPQAAFELTQDQSFLLDAGIDNLYQDILLGGILTIALLFLLLGNWASPLLMSISIPVSMVITFIFFYVFNISFNIISLSGLALGIGMLIDNSIVVINSITRKRQSGMNMEDSCVHGTNEVMAPVISQVLTTVAVYGPLVLLSGIAATLVSDQSIALTISLGVSLLVAFVLVPLLYKLLLKASPRKAGEDTLVYRRIAAAYHRMIDHILGHKRMYMAVIIMMMPAGILIATQLPLSSLPAIEKKESLVKIDWNAPIDARENLTRTRGLQQHIQPACTVTEAETGIQQFLMQQDNSNIQQAQLYFACNTEKGKLRADEMIRTWLRRQYPDASLQIIDAPNAFTQLFSSNTPYLEARFRKPGGNWQEEDMQQLHAMLEQMPVTGFKYGNGLVMEKSADILLDAEKMALYGVTRPAIQNKLQQLFGSYTITEIKRFGDVRSIRLKTAGNDMEAQFASLVKGSHETWYPLNNFISLRYAEQPKFITADQGGEYRSVVFEKEMAGVASLQNSISRLAAGCGMTVEFSGQYYENSGYASQLWMIFFTVLFLLYVILAIQYESLVLPVLVMLTIPLGITGSMLLLWTSGGSLNVMSLIGFIVVLGLIVDDPILKIETLNRLQKKYSGEGLPRDAALLKQMIHEAGDICLKPMLMVSLTTSIAMVPVLFISGLGNDLQKPLACVIIGGLTIGTFFTSWFIPLAYWYVTSWMQGRRT
jgi:multidrug efflux pump subunit AcrB